MPVIDTKTESDRTFGVNISKYVSRPFVSLSLFWDRKSMYHWMNVLKAFLKGKNLSFIEYGCLRQRQIEN